jgi:hypothetical protein
MFSIRLGFHLTIGAGLKQVILLQRGPIGIKNLLLQVTAELRADWVGNVSKTPAWYTPAGHGHEETVCSFDDPDVMNHKLFVDRYGNNGFHFLSSGDFPDPHFGNFEEISHYSIPPKVDGALIFIIELRFDTYVSVRERTIVCLCGTRIDCLGKGNFAVEG